ncbi:MAG: protein arginine kinase [Planctomycetes bacterium]|nr:protein arginine kinase [Planctomycetota bacterium]
MEIAELQRQAGEWLSGQGPESDIVMSSRVRLARNLGGRPFLTRATDEVKTEIERTSREALLSAALAEGLLYINVMDATPIERLFLVERHLISKEHANASGQRGVALGKKERISIMVNEEDHLRLQVLCSGYQLREAWVEMATLDDKVESRLDYAFSSQFGYLTACPTNVGTGMRVSVMLHLPALVMTRQIDKVFHAVSKINLAVRGLYGEGTNSSGDFFQISNQVTLGRAEEDLIRQIEDVVPQIIKYERNVRESLFKDNPKGLEDRVWRAYGMLRFARTITSNETMELLSQVRLGVNMKIIEDLDINTVNELFILAQPAHLQMCKGKKLDSPERDVARATFIRNWLE